MYALTLNEYIESLSGRKVTVVGAGISNRPLIGLLADAGMDVTVRDRSGVEALGAFYDDCASRGVKFLLGDGYLDGDMGDVVFRTPGMHPFQPALRAAAEKGSVVTSEMELFLSLCPCRVFAITGSDGKTTTTTITAELLKEAGCRQALFF